MYCSKCGKEIHNDAKFCIYCGNKIKKNTPDHSKYERFDYAPVVLRAEQGDEEAFTILWAKTNQPYRYYIYLQSKNKDACLLYTSILTCYFTISTHSGHYIGKF